MSTVRVVNIQHTDATEPNIVLEADGTTVFASGITISGGTNLTVSGTAEFASGTVSAPSITFIDDNNTGIYEPAADTVAITTAATERLRVDSSGNLGIGTTSVDFNDFGSNTGGVAIEDIGVSNTGLKIGEGSNDNYLIAAGNGSFYQSHYGSGSMIFGVGNGTGAEQMRIDSSGRLLVGTPSAETRFGFTPKLQVEGTGVDAGIALARYSNDNTGPVLIFSKSRGTSVGDNTSVIENSVLGAVYFAGADGTDQSSTGASIIAQVDGTPGSNDMPGRLTFSTTADGASSPTERMRIDSSGSLLMGRTSAYNSSPGEVAVFQGNRHGVVIFQSVNANYTCLNLRNAYANNGGNNVSGNMITFHDNGGTERGKIATNGSSTSYITSSDYRLKENVVPLTGAIDRINKLKVHRFNFIGISDSTVDGFLAHEAQTVVPEAVTGTKDEVDDDNNPVMQGIDKSKLVPLLTAALQEAIAKIETLEANNLSLENRIAALENN